MTRHSIPNLSDQRQGESQHFQLLCDEFGSGSQYFIAGVRGDCMIIEIRVSQDLMCGSPYPANMFIDAAFVQQARDSTETEIDQLLAEYTQDECVDSDDRITPIVSSSLLNSTYSVRSSQMKRVEVRKDMTFVGLQVFPNKLERRLLILQPVVELLPVHGCLWYLETRMPPFGLIHRIKPSQKPFLTHRP